MKPDDYFSGINYSLANEDTRIEHSLLPDNARLVLAVCGSGSRVIPLLARNPAELHIADLSIEQLMFFELRLAAIRMLDNDGVRAFLGYTKDITSQDRIRMFESLRPALSREAYDFWNTLKSYWSNPGFIMIGRWESHIRKLSALMSRYMFIRVDKAFTAHTLEDQLALLEKEFSPVRFKLFLRVAASSYVFNKFLYKGAFAGSSKVRTSPVPTWQMIYHSFSRFLYTELLRKNFFMQLMFLGDVKYPDGFPIEVRNDILDLVRVSKTKIVYKNTSYLPLLHSNAYDFASLSDTLSYLSPEDAGNLLLKTSSATPKGAIFVGRAFMRDPYIDVPHDWQECDEIEHSALFEDCTGVYSFRIFKKL